MLRQIIQESKVKAVRELLGRSERIVITCHMSPDGDAIGSSLGLMHVLAAIGKEARVVTPDIPPQILRFLPGAKDIVPYSKYTDFARQLLCDADLIFCLDFNSLYRVDHMRDDLASSSAPKVLVDHHQDPEDFADVIISHPDQSSTAILMFRLLCRLELFNLIDRKAAMCIYTGMMTDTGNFSYNSNDPDLYVVIAELIRKGINKDEIYKRVMDTKTVSTLRLNGYAVGTKMQIFPEHKAALITLTQKELDDYDYQKGDTEGLVNAPLAIPEVTYSVFLRDDKRYRKVSSRSKGDFPVNKLCEKYFNGGGHVNAAGGEFEGTLDEAVEVFMSSLAENDRYLHD